ncbi:hypothetical protein P4S72_21855 [Vibrio sp. PP-XX7]
MPLGLEEFSIIPTLWLYMLGAVNASRKSTQIRANVLKFLLKPNVAIPSSLWLVKR